MNWCTGLNVIDVHSVNHKEHMSTGRSQNSYLFNVQIDGTYSKQYALIR
jgi:hypothetical protein